MPELPEVETIRKMLFNGGPENPSLLGKTISKVEVLWARSIAKPTVQEFQERAPGQTIRDIGRRGKYLVFYLSRDALLVHLRMSGDLVVEPQDAPLASHHRVILNLAGKQDQANINHPAEAVLTMDKVRLAFNDARKFGRLWLIADPDEVLGSLGPEPLDPGFTATDLYQRLHVRRRQLKPLLMEQNFLAGLGNIYADEALHLARLHPLELSHLLTPEQGERLWEGIRKALQEGIRRNGASIDWVYRGGDFQNYFRVYQRTGEPCPECFEPIKRIVVGQRGTHYCPVCQRLSNKGSQR